MNSRKPVVTTRVYHFTMAERQRVNDLMKGGTSKQDAIKLVTEERAEARRKKITLCKLSQAAHIVRSQEPTAPPPIEKVEHESPKPLPNDYSKGPAAQSSPNFEDPILAAHIILGSRLTQKHGIEMLDGSPCDLGRKMTEANRARKSAGLPQLGKNRAWWV
jgi:hypothetical protein